MLKGKLTYIMAAIAVVYGIVGILFGWVDATIGSGIVWTGLTTFGVRRAIGD